MALLMSKEVWPLVLCKYYSVFAFAYTGTITLSSQIVELCMKALELRYVDIAGYTTHHHCPPWLIKNNGLCPTHNDVSEISGQYSHQLRSSLKWTTLLLCVHCPETYCVNFFNSCLVDTNQYVSYQLKCGQYLLFPSETAHCVSGVGNRLSIAITFR